MERLLRALRSAFDGGEQFLEAHDEGGDQWADFGWLWPSEERPHRMSRTLRIIVSRELLEDLEGVAPNQQEAAAQRIREAVARRLATFQREHDTPRDGRVPVEELRITSADIRP